MIFFSTCTSQIKKDHPLLQSLDFEEFNVGDFTSGNSGKINLNISQGWAKVISKPVATGEKSLKLMGPVSIIELDLQPFLGSLRGISLKAEKWSSKGAFKFESKKFHQGKWSPIKAVHETIPVGHFTNIYIDLEEPAEKIQFICQATEESGIVIDDLTFLSDAPMVLDSVVVKKPIFPVLKGKNNNPIMQILVHTSGVSEPLQVESLNLKQIGIPVKNVNVFYTGSSAEFSNHELFGKLNLVNGQYVVNGQKKLKHGTNSFWISCDLDESASLLEKLNPDCAYMIIDGEKILPENSQNKHALRTGIALRKHGEDNIDTYRIPGLATSNKGTLIAVYDIRRNSSVDLQEDIDVGMQRSTDGGKTWEPMKIIIDMGEYNGKPQIQNGVGDPSILVDRNTGTIWVAGIWAHGHPGKRNWWASKPGLTPEETSQFVLVKSDDDGKTWSEPINITRQIKKTEWYLLLQGPGKGITLEDGTLVFPAQFKDAEQIPHSSLIYSKNHGKTWHMGTGAKSHTTEAQIVQLKDGSLMLNMRDDRGRTASGARSVAITKDLGKTWVEHPSSRKLLPEPVCMASLITHNYKGKQLFLFSNPHTTKGRHHITIQVSKDEGNSWPAQYHMLLDEGYGRGYSCMTSIDEETIGILYEGSQADLIFQKIKIEELLSSPQ